MVDIFHHTQVFIHLKVNTTAVWLTDLHQPVLVILHALSVADSIHTTAYQAVCMAVLWSTVFTPVTCVNNNLNQWGLVTPESLRDRYGLTKTLITFVLGIVETNGNLRWKAL